MTDEQLAKVRELVANLEHAPRCAWCDNRASAYISFGPGEQEGDCCHSCMASFRRDERKFAIVAEHATVDVANAREALSALLAERDALKAAIEKVLPWLDSEVGPQYAGVGADGLPIERDVSAGEEVCGMSAMVLRAALKETQG